MKCHIVAECNHKYSWACTLHLAKMIYLLKYTIVKSYNVNIRFRVLLIFMVENVILFYTFQMQKLAFGSNNEHE